MAQRQIRERVARLSVTDLVNLVSRGCSVNCDRDDVPVWEKHLQFYHCGTAAPVLKEI